MREVYQTIEGKENGNCLEACIASILEMDITDIPNVRNTIQWQNEVNKFLNSIGYHFITVNIDDPSANLKGHHIIIGHNKILDCYHAKVGLDGKEVFDPSTSKPDLTDIHYGLIIKIL